MEAKTVQRKLAMRRALQHQKLAHEVIQRGQPDAGQRGDQEGRREPGRHRRDPAVIGDLERMPALIEQADDDEQRARRNAVVQHLVDRAIQARLCEAPTWLGRGLVRLESESPWEPSGVIFSNSFSAKGYCSPVLELRLD